METDRRKRWEVTLQLLGPMQIGAGTLGMVEKTELYAPGRVLWGALTNTLVGLFGDARPETYVQVGNALGNYGECFGSFFVSTDSGVSVWQPRYDAGNNRRVWINSRSTGDARMEADLRRELTFTLTSIGYAPKHEVENETLHATDLISHLLRDGESKCFVPLCLKGALDLPEELDIGDKTLPINEETLSTCFNAIRLGGGRKRGWGRVALKNISPSNDRSTWIRERTHEGYRWLLAPDYTVAPGQQARGRMNLAVYREYAAGKKQYGFGQAFSVPRYCWDIGTLLRDN